MTTIAETARSGARSLSDAGFDTPALDAEVLMRHLHGWDRTTYLMRRNEDIDEAKIQSFRALIDRRLLREPIAYIVGTREFMGLAFAVGPGALVPRPETELLVEWTAAWLADKHGRVAVDVGTGSGAIAIALTRVAPNGSLAKMLATDISEGALGWARRNAVTLAPNASIEFRSGSLLEPVRHDVDLVLANLPYLTPDQTDQNPDLAAEPRSALVSGRDGLDLIRALLSDLPRVLTSDGAAILELDPSQASTVADLARSIFPDAAVSVVPDLSGRARFVTIER